MKITLKIPNVSTNKMYTTSKTTGRKILSDIARVTKEGWQWEAVSQYKGEPRKGDLAVEIYLHFPDKKRRDLDNIKALLDSMSKILWNDDSQIVDLHIRKYVSPNNPRIEIIV
jgi:crossover junction endodeoxyribonuclease RusA